MQSAEAKPGVSGELQMFQRPQPGKREGEGERAGALA